MSGNSYRQSAASTRLSEYENISKRVRERKARYSRIVVPALAKRSYHLPGNDWCQDWAQYFRNNHPVFGICCHHKLHPLGMRERVVALIGSISFGLVLTNVTFLWFLQNNESMDETAFEISLRTNVTLAGLDEQYDKLSVTNGMVVLWTLGGLLHSMFDLSIWYISACACCRPGGSCSVLGCFDWVGSYLVIAIVAVVVALATFIVVLRASVLSKDEAENGRGVDDEVDWGSFDGVESFSFLWGYIVELVLALFAWYPVMGTILFSGALGCGKLPLLGGRPRELRRLQERTSRTSKTSQTSISNLSNSTGSCENSLENI